MSRKNKQKDRNTGSAGAPERRVTEAVHVAGEEREPVADNRPVPVLLLALLVALLFWGDMYIMRNGGDVGGEAGAFPARVRIFHSRAVARLLVQRCTRKTARFAISREVPGFQGNSRRSLVQIGCSKTVRIGS
jgi:hypothetical protein